MHKEEARDRSSNFVINGAKRGTRRRRTYFIKHERGKETRRERRRDNRGESRAREDRTRRVCTRYTSKARKRRCEGEGEKTKGKDKESEWRKLEVDAATSFSRSATKMKDIERVRLRALPGGERGGV